MPSHDHEEWVTARSRMGFQDSLDSKGGWFHSFLLPDGTAIQGHLELDQLKARLAQLPIGQDLTGKRVLDIGAWDGWYSFEMERRGAAVVAVDCVEVQNFLTIHKLLGSRVDYRVMDLFELDPSFMGAFDIVLFLSVLYHVRHPLLALQRVCSLTRDLAVVSSFVTDPDDVALETSAAEAPELEFYERDELGGNLDNWFGPNIACLSALCRTAGFCRVSLLNFREGHSAYAACYRRWNRAPAGNLCDPPTLKGAWNNRNSGTNFNSRLDEYLAVWFETNAPSLTRDEVFPEVGGYGVQPLYLGPVPGKKGLYQTNFLLPPGLSPGWHQVLISVRDSRPSNSLAIGVDVQPQISDRLRKHSHPSAGLSEG